MSSDGLVAQTFSTGFEEPHGILFDGTSIWVIDHGDSMLKKLDTSGNVVQSVPTGTAPFHAVFDGSNIWVPNFNVSTVTVVRAATGQVIATLSGNGLNFPWSAAFDGERILVTNNGGNSVSLWRATDLSPLGSYSLLPGSAPHGTCSDGVNFWVALSGVHALARF